LAYNIKGISVKTADELAGRLGVDPAVLLSLDEIAFFVKPLIREPPDERTRTGKLRSAQFIPASPRTQS
jgi:hypothetical protein